MGQTELFHEHKGNSQKWVQRFHAKMNSVTVKQAMRDLKIWQAKWATTFKEILYAKINCVIGTEVSL